MRSKKETSSLSLSGRFFWAMLILSASKIRLFSRRRRERFTRSALKRLTAIEVSLSHMRGDPSGEMESQTDKLPAYAYRSGKPCHLKMGGLRPAYSILIICTHAPTTNHAGGLRILDMVQMIKKKVPNAYVEIFSSANPELYGSIDKAVQICDRFTIARNYDFSLDEYLRLSSVESPYFDVIDFQFPQSIEIIESYRAIGKKIIFTPMESQIRNEELEFSSTNNPKNELSTDLAREEAEIIRTVDQTITVSEMDRKSIATYVDAPVEAIETGISEIEFFGEIEAAEAHSKNVCYIAYFGSETNRNALKWYLDHVHPIILNAVPEYKFSIIGRGNVEDILRPMPRGVNYVGEVDRIGPYIKGAAVGIAPALSGSGFRGKINQYAFFSVPTVASPISAEGLAYTDGDSIFVAEQPEDFAKAIVQLLENVDCRDKMAQRAWSVAQQNYTWDSKWPAVARTYDLPEHTRLFADLSVHAVVPSYQHGAYIEERIRSIFAQEYSNIRVTVIDDNSSDTSDEIIQRLQKEFTFDYIRREKNSGSPFSAWEYAAENTTEDFIWICESDDAADPMFVAKLVKLLIAKRSAKIAYCASWIVDESGEKIGTTQGYHQAHFHPSRWGESFSAIGRHELAKYVRFGMAIPNMSSALIDREVFRTALTPQIRRYRLAGDWLFLGRALMNGDIVFTPELLNRFRQHENTSRAITKKVREIAEHASVRLTLCDLVDAVDCERMNAVRHELMELIHAPELVESVLGELKTLDPDSAEIFTHLLDAHGQDNIPSEALVKAMALKAPLPIPTQEHEGQGN